MPKIKTKQIKPKLGNDMDMKCPKCGNTWDIEIVTSIWAVLKFDGVEPAEHTDWEFDDNSNCLCPECRYSGKVKDF